MHTQYEYKYTPRAKDPYKVVIARYSKHGEVKYDFTIVESFATQAEAVSYVVDSPIQQNDNYKAGVIAVVCVVLAFVGGLLWR